MDSTFQLIEQQVVAMEKGQVFFPAAGFCYGGGVFGQGGYGFYWSSTPGGSNLACNLFFNSGVQRVYYDDDRSLGYSVRAVLAEE